MTCPECGVSVAFCICDEQTVAPLHRDTPPEKSPSIPVISGVAKQRNSATVALPKIWTATELARAELPTPAWAVPNLIPEGFSLLVAAPKAGKSWLVLGVALQLALGQLILGAVEAIPGGVLYLALEDVPRRLQERQRALLTGPAPEDLFIVCEWPTGQEAVILLDAWLTEHPTIRLVIVDVIVRVRPPQNRQDSYQDDYNLGAMLKAVADKHHVALVGVHHTRKAPDNDFVSTILGTNGLAGSADAILVLRRARGEASAVLNVTGRDVEEKEYAMDFSEGRWTLSGKPAWLVQQSDGRRRIIEYLEDHPAARPKEITAALKMKDGTVRSLLHRMINDDLVTEHQGAYSLAAATTERLTQTDLTNLIHTLEMETQ